MTRKDYNLGVIAILNGNEVAEDTRNEILAYAESDNQKIADRNAKRASTPSKAQKENEPLYPAILATLNADTPTLSTAVATTTGLKTQKVTGLLGNLLKEGKVTKVSVPVKGKGKQTGWLLVMNDTDSLVD